MNIVITNFVQQKLIVVSMICTDENLHSHEKFYPISFEILTATNFSIGTLVQYIYLNSILLFVIVIANYKVSFCIDTLIY